MSSPLRCCRRRWPALATASIRSCGCTTPTVSPSNTTRRPPSVPAVSDDNFENQDALLLDVPLPTTGTYYIQVDTFASAEFNVPDTDTGNYELFLYRSKPVQAVSAAFRQRRRAGRPGRQRHVDRQLGQDHFFADTMAQARSKRRACRRRRSRPSARRNPAFEGRQQEFQLGGFTDDPANGPWTVEVNWGDGSPTSIVAAQGGSDLVDDSHIGEPAPHIRPERQVQRDRQGDERGPAFQLQDVCRDGEQCGSDRHRSDGASECDHRYGGDDQSGFLHRSGGRQSVDCHGELGRWLGPIQVHAVDDGQPVFEPRVLAVARHRFRASDRQRWRDRHQELHCQCSGRCPDGHVDRGCWRHLPRDGLPGHGDRQRRIEPGRASAQR